MDSKCSICKKSGGVRYTLALSALNVRGDYAHDACILKARERSEAMRAKYGLKVGAAQ